MTKDDSPEFFYFDMGNVLLSFDYDVAAQKMSQVCGASADKCREAGYGVELLTAFEMGHITRDQFHARFSELTGSQSDCDALLAARSDMFHVMVPTIRLLTQLKGVRKRTGLLSNTSIDHFDWCRARFGAIRDLFDVYVLSYEVRSMKPDRRIYEIAIERAGVPAEKIFYTDDREENVAAAKQLGLESVLFTDANQLLADLRSRGVELNF
jgi:putative hydrolase of the HAD superfamily